MDSWLHVSLMFWTFASFVTFDTCINGGIDWFKLQTVKVMHILKNNLKENYIIYWENIEVVQVSCGLSQVHILTDKLFEFKLPR